jgi:hypothetical protein
MVWEGLVRNVVQVAHRMLLVEVESIDSKNPNSNRVPDGCEYIHLLIAAVSGLRRRLELISTANAIHDLITTQRTC